LLKKWLDSRIVVIDNCDHTEIINALLKTYEFDLLCDWLKSDRLVNYRRCKPRDLTELISDSKYEHFVDAVCKNNSGLVRKLLGRPLFSVENKACLETAKQPTKDMYNYLQWRYITEYNDIIPAENKIYGLPIDQAAAKGDVEAVRVLMSRDYPDYSELALHNAIKNDHYEVIKVLLTCGRPLKYVKRQLLEYANNGKKEFVSLWQQHGKPTSFIAGLSASRD
jgi:hypothetical protein